MDLNRAFEIVESLGVINVTYKGNPVWIENIERKSNTAFVKDLKTGKIDEVNVSNLQE